MDRRLLRTSDEQLAAEFGRILDVFSRALSSRSEAAAFCGRVNEAGAQGLSWIEAVERAADSGSNRP